MVHRGFGLFGLAALVLALVGSGGAARGEDADLAKHLCDQLTPLVSMPDQSSDDGDVASADGDWPDAEQLFTPLAASPGAAPDDGSSLQTGGETGETQGSGQSAPLSWSFGADDSQAGAGPAQAFLVDLPAESQTFQLDSESIYETPAERSTEPHDFRINDRLKVKAQPLGGGLGGRVTLTFSFDSGY